MKYLLILSLVLTFNSALYAQDPLAFSELGFNHAYCRMFGYQNGNGLVYISATGGTPDYTYSWVELSTGDSFGGSTWGGLNPGNYEITVTDALGETVIDTIFVDSLNPIADFTVSGDGLDEIYWGYIGDAPVEVFFENTSQYFANPLNPVADTTFFFRPHGVGEWDIYHNYAFFDSYTYEYSGIYTAALIAQNKNGCTDTTYKTIGLFGPAGLVDETQGKYFEIASHSINGQLVVSHKGFDQGVDLKLYSLGGKEIFDRTLTDAESTFQLNQASGIYIYELRDHMTGIIIESGKINL